MLALWETLKLAPFVESWDSCTICNEHRAQLRDVSGVVGEGH